MTLIIYVRCRDGCVLISDRQASEPGGHSREDKKAFVSEDRSFIIAGAGKGSDASIVCSSMSQEENNDESSIRQNLNDVVDNYRSRYSQSNLDFEAIAILREETGITAYEIFALGGGARRQRMNPDFRPIGLSAAIIIADYFLKKLKLSELDWKKATQYGIAIMKAVADVVNGVGRLEDFGFDVNIALDNGQTYVREKWREDTADLTSKVEISRDISEFFEIPNEEEN